MKKRKEREREREKGERGRERERERERERKEREGEREREREREKRKGSLLYHSLLIIIHLMLSFARFNVAFCCKVPIKNPLDLIYMCQKMPFVGRLKGKKFQEWPFLNIVNYLAPLCHKRCVVFFSQTCSLSFVSTGY